MRLYTIDVNGKECVAVAQGQSQDLILLESLGICVKDMNELITRFTELEPKIKKSLEESEAKSVSKDEYRILAPIPVPMQDVICLGVNYSEHIKETAPLADFTDKTDAVYFSKRVNRSNDPGGSIPVYAHVDSLDYEVELGVVLHALYEFSGFILLEEDHRLHQDLTEQPRARTRRN